MCPETINGVQAQVDQDFLQRTFRDGERKESLATTKTLWEQNRSKGSDKDNEPTPRTVRAFEEKPSYLDDKKTSSVDYQLRTGKLSNPKPYNNKIDRNTTNQKRGKYQSSSNSDSEGQEENEKIIRLRRKQAPLKKKRAQ